MKNITLCLLAIAFTCAAAGIVGGQTEKSLEVTPAIKETLVNGLIDAAKLNGNSTAFKVEPTNFELIKHTSQVVNGLLDTYVFKFTAGTESHISSITVWNAPWEPKAGLTSACIMKAESVKGLLTAQNALTLLKENGTCVSK